MSGKYQKKKSKKSTARRKAARTRKVLWGICIALMLLVAVLIFLVIRMESGSPAGKETIPGAVQETAAEPAPIGDAPETDPVTEPGENAPDEEQALFDLGSGVRITEFLPYTGAFMEDRTDEVVADVLAIEVTNTGEEYIQTMDITLTGGDTEAVFSLSTLLPGDTVVVLEKNRMAYSTVPEFTGAAASGVAFFSEPPTMCEDLVEIQCLDGVINVTNISGADITGDILIYYKNRIGGVYYGGLTYRLRIGGGLKAGEIRQGSAAHFNPDNSVVVFVDCG